MEQNYQDKEWERLQNNIEQMVKKFFADDLLKIEYKPVGRADMLHVAAENAKESM
ncbi:MAG: hypothetical protein CSYNP_01469 [Syntrophus sp. SKADARSKE-3]|nr:hypothetical protein [Syntrophus sp. SKADARSKE-3]